MFVALERTLTGLQDPCAESFSNRVDAIYSPPCGNSLGECNNLSLDPSYPPCGA